MHTTTLLSLTVGGSNVIMSDWALRGIVASLEPIAAAGQVRRDVNGNLVSLGQPQFRKYKVSLSCSDQESPGFALNTTDREEIWPGTEVQITLQPQLGAPYPVSLNAMVMSPGWKEQFDEYGAVNSWSLDLEQR